jgi:hypothetical protein
LPPQGKQRLYMIPRLHGPFWACVRARARDETHIPRFLDQDVRPTKRPLQRPRSFLHSASSAPR